MFISELHIQGYKRLRDVKLPLGPLTVLIGPNASGKSSVLQALEVLSRSAGGHLSEALTNLGGLASLVSRGGDRRAAEFGTTAPGSMGEWRYRVALQPGLGASHEVANEALAWTDPDRDAPISAFQREGQRLRVSGAGPPSMIQEPTESALSAAGRIGLAPEHAALAQRLANFWCYRPLDMWDDPPVRRPQKLTPVHFPAANGADLVSALHAKRTRDRRMFGLLEDTLRIAYPGFEGLDTELVAAGHAVLQWRERGQVYHSHELSDGALRFLWLLTLLTFSEGPPLLGIDEPEVSLHPELIKILSDLLDDASHRTQLLVATQSPELISWLKPEQVVVLDLDEDGWTTATPATELDLDTWLDRYTLGQLWVRGDMGGRP
jgi:predicted ATPase